MVFGRKHITLIAAVFTMLISCLVMIGWYMEIPLFKSVLPGNISMKFNTVICFFGFVILVILILLLIIVSRNTHARIKAEKEARQLAGTLEKRVEERTHQLQLAEHQFRYTLDNMIEGAEIIGFDWRFIYVNNAMEQQCKMSRKELIGFTPMEKYPGFKNTDIYEAIRYCLAERASAQMEYEFIFPDQSKKYFELSIQPVPEGAFILSVDITESKKAEKMLLASEEKYRAIIDNSLMAILIARPGHLIIETNPAACELFGYTSNEFLKLGREHILDFSDPLVLQKLKERDVKGCASGEFTAVKKNGERFHCELTSFIFKDIHGENMSCAMIADISTRKNTEQQLKDVNVELHQLSRYLKNVREDERLHLSREVHDQLGQLASAIKMEIDWLNIHLTGLDAKAKARIDHALYIVKVLIGETRKIAGSLRPVMIDELGLNASLKWLCTEFQRLHGIACAFTDGYDDSNLDQDTRTELFRICQESLNNTMRYAKATHVKVLITEKNKNLEMSITDNGNGFDATENENHFNLVEIRERVASVNGILQIESKPGKGTTIHITVPDSS